MMIQIFGLNLFIKVQLHNSKWYSDKNVIFLNACEFHELLLHIDKRKWQLFEYVVGDLFPAGLISSMFVL